MYLIIDRDLLPFLKGHIACSHDIGRYHKIHDVSSDLVGVLLLLLALPCRGSAASKKSWKKEHGLRPFVPTLILK